MRAGCLLFDIWQKAVWGDPQTTPPRIWIHRKKWIFWLGFPNVLENQKTTRYKGKTSVRGVVDDLYEKKRFLMSNGLRSCKWSPMIKIDSFRSRSFRIEIRTPTQNQAKKRDHEERSRAIASWSCIGLKSKRNKWSIFDHFDPLSEMQCSLFFGSRSICKDRKSILWPFFLFWMDRSVKIAHDSLKDT